MHIHPIQPDWSAPSFAAVVSCTMHRGRPHDEMQPRDLRRATTLDVGSSLDEAGD